MRRSVQVVIMGIFALNGASLLGQQQTTLAAPSTLDSVSPSAPAESNGAGPKPAPATDGPHKIGPLDVTVNWRFRTEAWDFFQPPTGQPAYAFEHSLLKIGIGQKSEAFEWLIEGAAVGIINLPPSAVQPGRQGQLGLGGTYYAANGNVRDASSGFLKQAYVGFKLPAKGKARLGRFTFLDGVEAHTKDKTLATLINTRIAQRLIGDFSFSAVQRSFDGLQLGFDAGNSSFTFFGARPTEGVYQVQGIDELDINLFYGSFNVPITTKNNTGELRVFAIGYMDDRAGVLKTDNRPVAVRTADTNQIRIGTYGADYVHVLHTDHQGQFDFLAWGAFQNGGWGVQTQRAVAFVGELGWQPPIHGISPWFSAGYSYGSGDSNPGGTVHGTFFQILPTPRPYDRFPFYNMMNNEDFYGSAVFRLPRSFAIRSELHALRLANAQDLWYSGGGAFQSNTFGYTGRASSGARSLANVWDVSLDVPLRYGFSITTYYAHAWGKSVIAKIFATGTNAQFGYVETNFRF
ncbi:MAG TPA: alginate export family protein [Candidatus Acidoferrales bacterium]|nr:alginate export family protein [Candidatus Acidoferrales bacterium]